MGCFTRSLNCDWILGHRMPKNYDKSEGDPDLGEESTRDLAKLSNHIQRWWGDAPRVFHEIMSEYAHIDLHLVPATPDRQHHVVITTGMSDRPMIDSKGVEHYCELLMALPPDWPIEKEKFNDERIWWPFRQLKSTARFPHVVKTLIWYSHTVCNENPPRPFHASVPFCGGILSIPVLCPKEAWSLHVRPDKQVFFFAWIPLFENELKFAWNNGSKSLFDKLDKIDATELIDVHRKSCL
jgi:hypothetical protein